MVLKFYYHPNSPPSKAIWMMLEHGNIPYEAHKVDLMTGEHKKEEYLKINPLGQVPAMVDGDFCIWESRAIAPWLIAQHGQNCSSLYPSHDIKKKAYVDQVMFLDGSTYEEKIVQYLNLGGVITRNEGIAVDKLDDLKEGLKVYDHFLGKHKFVAGNEITVADFLCLNSLWVLTYAEYKSWDEFPNVKRWFENEMKVLPAFKKCIEDEVAGDQFKAFYQGKLAEMKQKEAPEEPEQVTETSVEEPAAEQQAEE